jgi:[acyl-carrier-protein] S-malonyltransferase
VTNSSSASQGLACRDVAFVFPGQGAQEVGMGADVAAQSRAARDIFDVADAALGLSLSTLCFEGPPERLAGGEIVQPAILATSVALLAALRERLSSDAQSRLRCVAGHSLGEYTALVAANALSFADALALVRERARLMSAACAARPGAMAAILGLDPAQVVELCQASSSAGGVVAPANFNAAEQTVISGDLSAVERAVELARAQKAKRVVLLQVAGAFHSPLMAPAADAFATVLQNLSFGEPSVSIVSNVTGALVDGRAELPRELAGQITAPVQWVKSVQTMLDQGVRCFVELGPGDVLTKLIRRMDRQSTCLSVADAAGLQKAVDFFSEN